MDDENLASRIQQNITNEVMDSITQAITDEVKKAINASKRELTEISAEACSNSLSELTAKAAKAARLSLSTEWKSVHNKKAYQSNEEVMEELTRAEHNLEKGNVDFALECIKTGKSLLQNRMKLIRIADREELGWKVVKHYEADDLCEGSEDEKNLNRARRSAVAEEKSRKFESQKATAAPRQPRPTSPPIVSTAEISHNPPHNTTRDVPISVSTAVAKDTPNHTAIF